MKNIIIAGPSRAGKTTLARKINEELNYFVISVDKLVATFQGAYPQLNIKRVPKKSPLQIIENKVIHA